MLIKKAKAIMPRFRVQVQESANLILGRNQLRFFPRINSFGLPISRRSALIKKILSQVMYIQSKVQLQRHTLIKSLPIFRSTPNKHCRLFQIYCIISGEKKDRKEPLLRHYIKTQIDTYILTNCCCMFNTINTHVPNILRNLTENSLAT